MTKQLFLGETEWVHGDRPAARVPETVIKKAHSGVVLFMDIIP